MIQLNYRDSKPIYEQIKDGVRKLILSDSLSVDERLPSVRELAASLAINPNTILRAYRDLENSGYIYTIPGKGSFVAEHASVSEEQKNLLLHSFDEIVADLLALSVGKKELQYRIENMEGGEDS